MKLCFSTLYEAGASILPLPFIIPSSVRLAINIHTALMDLSHCI